LPTVVANYPAVDVTTDARGPRARTCTVDVGVTAHATIAVTAIYPSASGAPLTPGISTNPWPDADNAATSILDQAPRRRPL